MTVLTATRIDAEVAEQTASQQTFVQSKALVLVRWTAIAAWLLGFVWWTVSRGIALDRTQLFVIICTGLIAATVGRRGALMVIRDWLPFAAVLFVYDLSRGAASMLGRPTLWYSQINFDRSLFGIEPTVWLQSHLKQPHAPWWEVVDSVVYVSFFCSSYVLAGVLWLRSRDQWRKFVFRFVAVSFIGLAGFIAFPAAPPWAAAQCSASEVAGGPSDPGCLYAAPGSAAGGGLLGQVTPVHHGAASYVERISNRGWDRLGLNEAKVVVDEGQATVNQVAAIPSLHAAISMLIAAFLWPRVRKRWRPLVVAYPLAMAFSLVYSGEHYVFDILLGWIVTGVVSVAFSCWEARQELRQELRRLLEAAPGIDSGRTDTLEGPLLERT